MFQDWKQAWRAAVENFQRELDDDRGDDATRAMRRDERVAAEALVRLEAELDIARRDAASQRESEAVCRRREAMALKVDDAETARIAAQFADRHAERASLMERKTEVLEAERALLVRDLEHMHQALAERGAEPRVAASGAAPRVDDSARDEGSFRKMERDVRERAAEERLEELKRKLR